MATAGAATPTRGIGIVNGTMATACMAESRKEGRPGSWLWLFITVDNIVSSIHPIQVDVGGGRGVGSAAAAGGRRRAAMAMATWVSLEMWQKSKVKSQQSAKCKVQCKVACKWKRRESEAYLSSVCRTPSKQQDHDRRRCRYRYRYRILQPLSLPGPIAIQYYRIHPQNYCAVMRQLKFK